MIFKKSFQKKPYSNYDQSIGVVHLGARENHGEGTRQIYSVTSG